MSETNTFGAPEHHADLIEDLREEHRIAPFLFTPHNRETLQRVEPIIAGHNIEYLPYRGSVETRNFALDSYWLVVAPDTEDEYILDLVVPIKDQVFVEELGIYVMSSIATFLNSYANKTDDKPEDLTEMSKKLPIESRVIGDVPAGVKYYGEPFWGRS